MKPRERTDYIVIHCSASPPTVDFGVKEIRRYHKSLGWQDIGYHYVIRRDGTVEEGRKAGLIGSHVKGHNATSLGVCLVGGVNSAGKPVFNFTADQMDSLATLVGKLRAVHNPNAKIVGHRDFAGVAKACPSFDVAVWLKLKGIPQ